MLLGGHAHAFQHLLNAVCIFRLGMLARGLQDKIQIVKNRSVHQKLEILEDNAEVPAEEGDISIGEVSQVIAHKFTFAGRQRQVCVEGFEQGGLSRTGRPDQINEVTFVHFEAYLAQNQVVTLINIGVSEGEYGAVGGHRHGLCHKLTGFCWSGLPLCFQQ